MRIELDPEDIARIVRALDHYWWYLRSQQRDDSSYRELAERLKQAR